MIQSGRITTSLTANGHGLGYADNATLGRTTFGGLSVGTNSVLIGYTFVGDTNLDGKVNAMDFNSLASSFGASSGALWINGDLNYDGAVDSSDFAALALNFNTTMPSPAVGVLVPEPSLGLLPLMMFARIRRKR